VVLAEWLRAGAASRLFTLHRFPHRFGPEPVVAERAAKSLSLGRRDVTADASDKNNLDNLPAC